MQEIYSILAASAVLEILTAIAAGASGYASLKDILGRLAKFRYDRFKGEISRRAELCRTKTGYVGALLARYTAIITINVLVSNVCLNMAAIARTKGTALSNVPLLQEGFYLVAAICSVSVCFTAFVIFAICKEVIKQSETV